MASFRFPFPASSSDPWSHREEDVTLARMNSNSQVPQQHKRIGSFEPSDRPATGKKDIPTDVLAAAAPGSAAVPGYGTGPGHAATTPSAHLPRKNWVFADPVAFRYLEDDPSVTVTERREILRGYELYLVEQWACSREAPTLVIVTYTGDEKHSITVGVLGVPADDVAHSPRLRLYREAIQQCHARPKETDLGELMVTNLSSFPSALTVIPVPDGDIRAHRQSFIVNENLKRLGCSGRSGMALTDPTSATQAKFYQQYKANDRIPFSDAVLELVKLCQTSLYLFGHLRMEFIDGLLCDKTETAIGNWWTEMGSEYYNVEPTDGILGPTTVAALLGMLMGARKRLSYLGAPVVKDAFDIANTRRGISWFQKTHKLEKTKRLDRQTILKLHSVTAKAAAGEGWGVQKAVKSTVAEIGGKRGELVIGMVGGRDKGAIGDIETLDIEKFIELASGERAKWLWYGKPKSQKIAEPGEKAPDMGALLFGKEEQLPGSTQGKRVQSLPLEEELQRSKEESPLPTPAPISASALPDGSPGEKEALRRGVFKTVAGRVNDARSGLGRIKDTIGSRRGHVSRPSRDDFSESGYSNVSNTTPNPGLASAPVSSPVAGVPRAFTWNSKPQEYLDGFKREAEAEQEQSETLPSEKNTAESEAGGVTAKPPLRVGSEWGHPLDAAIQEEDTKPVSLEAATSALDKDLLGPFEAERADNVAACYLQRRHSISFIAGEARDVHEARYARRLSFSNAEEAVLGWDDIVDFSEEASSPADPAAALQRHTALAELSRSLYQSMHGIRAEVSPWVLSSIASVEDLDAHFDHEQNQLQSKYYQLSETFQRAKQGASELVAAERGRATEAIREVEVTIARLEYEVNALQSKVGDVEDGVQLFERQVEDVEARAEELKATLETEGWFHWFMRTVTGIGTGPNITREAGDGTAST